MSTPILVRVSAAVAVSAYALIVLVPRWFPATPLARWLTRTRRQRQRDLTADLTIAAAYHAQLSAESRAGELNERTWQDLDLDEVFHSIDYTACEPGRQFLYHLLRTPRIAAEPLEQLEKAVHRLAVDAPLAHKVRASLGRLADPRAGEFVNLLFGELPRRPRISWILPLLTAASIACLATVAVWPRAALVWVAICAINICVQIGYRPRVKRFIPALHEVPGFLRVARELGELDFAETSTDRRCLGLGAKALNALRWVSTWLKFDPGEDAGGLTASVYEYINLLFLLDVNAFVAATVSLRESRALMLEMFEAIGYLDAVQSIAAWRASLPRWSLPEFTETRKTLHGVALTHPLVEDPVPNSIDVSGQGVIITGSNMSGKTTFIRTLGINAILAQTLHTVCGEAWRAPLMHVGTSIGRADSVVEGKSYYLAEVESVRTLVRATGGTEPHLFLLDEIFRGTNTTERVAAARAVLAYLNRGDDLVVVATHDMDVIGLLGDTFEAYHFREEIVNGAMMFDYRIHAGPSSSHNAIALLELMQYPRELVDDALATLDSTGPGAAIVPR